MVYTTSICVFKCIRCTSNACRMGFRSSGVTIWALRDSRYWLRGGSDMDVAEPRGEIFFSGVCVGRYFIGNMVAMETLAPTRHAAKTA